MKRCRQIGNFIIKPSIAKHRALVLYVRYPLETERGGLCTSTYRGGIIIGPTLAEADDAAQMPAIRAMYMCVCV